MDGGRREAMDRTQASQPSHVPVRPRTALLSRMGDDQRPRPYVEDVNKGKNSQTEEARRRAVAAAKAKRPAPLPPIKGRVRPPLRVGSMNDGEKPQAKEKAYETKYFGGDELSKGLETTHPSPEKLSEPPAANARPYNPIKPIVDESLEEPATVTMPNHIAVIYPPKHLDKNLQFHVNPVQDADDSFQPSLSSDSTHSHGGDPPLVAHPVSDPSTLATADAPASKRLISRDFFPHEIISLIETIFASKDEFKMIRDLRGDDAQTFIDVIHEVCTVPFPFWGTD